VADSEGLKERRLELQYQFRFRLIEFAAQMFDRGIPITGLVLVAYFGIFRPVHDLAGQKTQATFGLSLLADIRPAEIASYLFGLVGWIFGLNAQRLRRNVTERLTSRIAEYERNEDPNRTSSGLTTRGKTPPEKKP
jgi:hypothetical protein